MYTRRYPSGSHTKLIPPPDYSGTSIRYEEEAIPEEEASTRAQVALPRSMEEPLLPPPPMGSASGGMPGDDDGDGPGAGMEEDERLTGGASRRPDLDAPPLPTQPRFTERRPLGERPSSGNGGAQAASGKPTRGEGRRRRMKWRRGPHIALPEGTHPHRPILPPLPDEGYRPSGGRRPRPASGAASGVPSAVSSAMARLSTFSGDEWLLIGLLVLLLTGSEGEVKEHLDLILLLGALLLIGR